jgi:hypothetical protein
MEAGRKITIYDDAYKGLEAYQVSDVLIKLGCKQELISTISRAIISFWDMFISTGKTSSAEWPCLPAGRRQLLMVDQSSL